ncbi:MAG: hypothetical protein K9I94_02215 [Bacteroidales bacterium]|nr:hypothetical protein [Bacteroidales bacterium]
MISNPIHIFKFGGTSLGSGERINTVKDIINDLIRPALYGAKHHIKNLSGEGDIEQYHVVGPVCESSDVFGEDIDLPRVRRGNYLAIKDAGAYGESMASTYNLRRIPQAVYSGKSRIKAGISEILNTVPAGMHSYKWTSVCLQTSSRTSPLFPIPIGIP